MFIRLTLKPLAKVWMGNADERFSAFGDGLSLEIDHAVFGHDIHDIGARRGHNVARREVEHNPAATVAPLVISGGRQINDLPPFEA